MVSVGSILGSEVVMDWQDISTAPKDEKIILTDGHLVDAGIWNEETAEYFKNEIPWDHPCYVYGEPASLGFYPTYWAPMPSPPKEKPCG